MAQDLLALADAASNALDSDTSDYDSDSASDSDTNFSNTIGCATAATAIQAVILKLKNLTWSMKGVTGTSNIGKEYDMKLAEAAHQKEIRRRAKDLYMAALHDVDAPVTPEAVAAAYQDYAIARANTVAACAEAQDCLDRIHQHERSIADAVNVHVLLLGDYAVAALASIDEPFDCCDLDSDFYPEVDAGLAELERIAKETGRFRCKHADLEAAADVRRVEIEELRYIQTVAAEGNCYFKRAEAEHHANVAIREARIASAQAADAKKNIAIATMEEGLQQARLFKRAFYAANRFFDSST